MPAFNSFLNHRLTTLSWGIKASSKRRLEIDHLYLNPEDESEEQKGRRDQPLDF